MELIEKELKRINRNVLIGKRIMLCGRIEHLQQIIYRLGLLGISVDAILDNDKKKNGLYVDTVPICAPEKLLAPYQRNVCVIIYSPKYWEEMLEQMESFGYREGEQVFVLDRPDEKKNIQLIKRGYELYQSIQDRYGEDVMVFMANCPLGDYYLLGIFFHQYCQLNHIEKYVMVGSSAGIEKLADMLAITNTKRLDIWECNSLIRAWIFLGEKKIRFKPLTIWQGAFRFNPCLTRQKEKFTFMDTFKKMIYHLPDEINPCFPKVCYNKERIQQLFAEYGLQQGKTVLLSPHSYSLQSLPVIFWKRLVKEIRKKGYTVAVNIGDEREINNLPDTVTLKQDFMTIMGVMEYAGTVIGMRSGFFDITSQAKCKRIILYPRAVKQNINWNSTDMDFCSLKSMELCEDALEWEVEQEELMIQNIMLTI